MDLNNKGQTPSLFNHIASRYDFINRVLSFGIDRFWRKALVNMLPRQSGLRVLDVAAGTGDQTIALLASPRVSSVVALDPSIEMLRVAKQKLKHLGANKSVEFEESRVEQMPFLDASFDVATMSFGIRNVPDVLRALRELNRVLKPAGSLLILEFSIPESKIVRSFHLAYLRHVLPRVGGLLSGSQEAYRYLDRSIEQFPYGEAFCEELRSAGFVDVAFQPLWFGIVTIYRAKR